MDDRPADIVLGGGLTLTLYGSVRGKLVAAMAHAYALMSFRLELPPKATNAPWHIPGKEQDYFAWRRATVEERNALQLSLAGLFGGDLPVQPGAPIWHRIGGVAQYNPDVANALAGDYARGVVRMLGLSRDQA